MTKIKSRRRVFVAAVTAAATAFALSACSSSSKSNATTSGGSKPASSSHGKYNIALSLSYTGNDWQNEAANLVKAEAATPPYSTLVSLHEDIAGADVTKQIDTLNNEINAGYKAIIVYPISPSALNGTIQKACQAGIVVFAYDSLVTAPCAYNVHIDQYEWGIYSASWLANQLHGQGNIADITGVPGTTVDTDRQKALKDVLAKYPGIHVVGSANGSWAQAQGKTAFLSILASHPNIDGVYAEAGCYAITQYLLSANKPTIPCAGEMSNGHHVYMLPKNLGGADLQSSSAGSPVYSGELALIDAVKVLQGQKVPHDTILPLPKFDTAQLDAKGSSAVGTNPAQGALVFPPNSVPPGFFGDFWSPLVEQGLQGALTGSADKISTAQPCSAVANCKMQNKLIFDSNHSGGN